MTMIDNMNDKGHLVFDGCDTIDLIKEYGSPLYVVSQTKMDDKCNELKNDFINKYDNVSAAYASKAFLNLAMCRIIDNHDLHLDVVSGGELYTAIKADFPTEKIFFHGNNKSIDEIEYAIEENVGRIVVDNFYELDLIQAIAKEQDKVANILFRVSPGVDSDTHQYVITGQKDSKFGIPFVEGIIFDAIEMTMNLSNVNLMGFHFHVGSQIFDNKSHVEATVVLMEVIKEAKDRFGFETKELNTGGGFGIHYVNGDKPRELSYFMDAVMDKIIEKSEEYGITRPRVIIEPGRWLIGEAGITLYTIGSIKEIPGIRTYVGIDGGMPDNPRPALYGSKYFGVLANKADQKPEELVTIAGKCCESGDILIRDIELPSIESGDILAVFSTGAYNYSMASNYNKLRRPAVALVSNGKADIIVERQSYGDLISHYRIPKSLNV